MKISGQIMLDSTEHKDETNHSWSDFFLKDILY